MPDSLAYFSSIGLCARTSCDGVDFTLRKDKTTQPPHYIVIFKAKDADNLEQAFREFTAKTLTKEQRPSIRKVLAAAKQKAAQQPKRAKEKIKQRGLER